MTANLPPASGGPAARGAEDELYPATDGAVTPLAVDTPGVEAVGVAPGPTQATTEPGAEARGTSVWGAAFQRLRRNPAAIAGAVIVALFLLVAVLAPLLAPYGGTETPGMREIEAELEAYAVEPVFSQGGDGVVPLNERPRLVALNKTDLPDGAEMADMVRAELEGRGLRVFDISALAREGLEALKYAMADLVTQARERVPEPEAPAPVEVPRRFHRKGERGEFTVVREERNLKPLFRVRGEKPEKWVAQTDFVNDEAVGYLADRLQRLGVEDGLFKAGATPGDAVVIGDDESGVLFDWEPTLSAGAELLAGPRGTDLRLDERSRATRAEKRAEQDQRRAARAATRAEMEAERRTGLWTVDETEDPDRED